MFIAALLTSQGIESILRQVDKKSRGPQGESDLEFSRRRKGQTFFPLFIPEDYITRYPA